MSRTIDLGGLGYGLTTEKQLHINRLLQDYDPHLSLRRIPEGDPAAIAGAKFTPPKVYGVWEDNVAAGQPNWVFTLAEMSIDERVLARIASNDMQKVGADKRMANFMALQGAAEASRMKKQIDLEAERREEMIGIGELAGRKTSFRHTLNGEDVIIGDTIRPARRQI